MTHCIAIPRRYRQQAHGRALTRRVRRLIWGIGLPPHLSQSFLEFGGRILDRGQLMVYDRSIVRLRVHGAVIMRPLPQYSRRPRPHNPPQASLIERARMGLRMTRT